MEDLSFERLNTKPKPRGGTLDTLTTKLLKFAGDTQFKHVSIHNKIMSRSLSDPKGDSKDYYDIVDKHAGSDIVIVNYLNTQLGPSVDSHYTLDNKLAWKHITRDINARPGKTRLQNSQWKKKKFYCILCIVY